ncbi:unnamed protein product, partial [Mesorhabditis belari]|uniref:Sodium/potassium-transporting ATPase subunit alpha n=1 Tax=Mesorhabditis belari TaxID=2138241 RepID=A0AAF3FH74_9BILA
MKLLRHVKDPVLHLLQMIPWIPWFRKKQKDLDDLKKEVDMDEHKISLDELCQRFTTDPRNGLSSSEAAERLKTNGPNSLTPPAQKSVIIELGEHLFGGFNFLLWGAGFFSLLGFVLEVVDDKKNYENLYMAILMIVIVLGTGSFSFYQNRTSANIMKSFANMIPTTAHVIRDGRHMDIKAEEVVLGDLICVSGGDKVPADVRVTESKGLKVFASFLSHISFVLWVDNSSMTGESEPLFRTAEFTHDNALETKNMMMFSTNVVEGTGRGIVVKVGDNTVMGRIAAITATVSPGPTPIVKEINHFIRIIGSVAFVVASACFIAFIAEGGAFLDAIVFMMGIFVANVPEGITATVTASLTLTAKKMRKKHCLVKKLDAVETLGSTSTICSDKTGTLTQNRMTVAHVWFDGRIDEAVTCGEKGEQVGEGIPLDGCYADLMRCATLCSRSDFKTDDIDVPVQKRDTVGDASETAILKYCELVRSGGEPKTAVHDFRDLYPKVAEQPFNSINKYQLSIHTGEKNGAHVIMLKGAPEKVLAMCKSMATSKSGEEINEKSKAAFQNAYDLLGGMGERVLGFAELVLPIQDFPPGFTFDTETVNFPVQGLRFLGLISMIDPPRPGVPMAVRLCQSAGVKVVMVTGDHPITAQAIAKHVHIIDRKARVTWLVDDEPVVGEEEYGTGRLQMTEAIVVHGEQLKKLTEKTIDSIVSNYQQVVFARTSPTQKLQIVEAYQRNGQIVAVTGDGVNDAPALRKADIGIAMGIAGTDVSKQAANMILLNDNFASIVTGVEEGRIIFDNLKKSIAYVLTSNIGEVTPFISNVIFGLPLPMSLISILLIDMGTDLWPAVSLAYEAPENDIMNRPPRNSKHEKLVNSRLILFSYLNIGIIQATAGFCTYFYILMLNGFMPLDLFWKREKWTDPYFENYEDSWGQEWSYQARKDLLYQCHSGFFATMVIVQWADLWISKTRKNSMVNQGMQNWVMNYGMLSTVMLMFLFLYVPGLSMVLGQVPLRLTMTMIAVPFAVFIYMYDETRKFIIRKRPGGIVYRLTNY